MGVSWRHPQMPATRSNWNMFPTTTVDNLLKQFWESEEYNLQQPVLSLDERTVVEHFHSSHSRDHTGRYIVPLPMKTDVTPPGESTSLAVKRFKALECSLRAKSQFNEFTVTIREYFEMDYAEPVPVSALPGGLLPPSERGQKEV